MATLVQQTQGPLLESRALHWCFRKAAAVLSEFRLMLCTQSTFYWMSICQKSKR